MNPTPSSPLRRIALMSGFVVLFFMSAFPMVVTCQAQSKQQGSSSALPPEKIIEMSTVLLGMDGLTTEHKYTAYTSRAKAYVEKKQTSKALDDLAAALQLPGLQPEQKAMAHLMRGDIYMEAGQWSKAVSEFTAGIDTPGLAKYDEIKLPMLVRRSVSNAKAKGADAVSAIASDMAEIERFPDSELRRNAKKMMEGVVQYIAGDLMQKRGISSSSGGESLPWKTIAIGVGAVVALMIVVFLGRLILEAWSNRKVKPRKQDWAKKEPVVPSRHSKEIEDLIRRHSGSSTPVRSGPRRRGKGNLISPSGEFDANLRKLIGLYSKPSHLGELAGDCLDLIFISERDISQQTTQEIYRDETFAGWSAAALGRCICHELDSISFVVEMKKFDLAVTARAKDLVAKSWIAADLPVYLDAHACNPVCYLFALLMGAGGQQSKFAQQGAIMGLIDFLSAHRAHPDIARYHEQIIQCRSAIVATAEQQSFFEVRVPSDATPQEYAVILDDVLRSANEEADYCDTGEFMQYAVDEIPGVMKLLAQYPLRLIDPMDKETGGFHASQPFQLLLGTNYTPPVGVGRVNARYLLVMDMTTPLAVGLNLSLFSNPYSAIPVLFHEHEHHLGDRNEASVFLKTHLFSMDFYTRHPGDHVSRDIVYGALLRFLGEPPSDEQYAVLNDLILTLYGPVMTEGEAEAKIEGQIADINGGLANENRKQTWHPEVKYPLLGINDVANATKLRDILFRALTVSRSISQEEFREIVDGWDAK